MLNKQDLMKFSAVILSGGQNKRFDGNIKSLQTINGMPIIERILKAIDSNFDEIYIVTNIMEAFDKYRKQAMIIEDIYKNIGPLGGLHAGLSSSSADAVFLFGGDMPFIDRDLVNKMLNRFEVSMEALVPVNKKRTEPLHAIYAKKITSTLEQYIIDDMNRSINHFITKIDAFFIPSSNENSFININTKKELQFFNNRFKS